MSDKGVKPSFHSFDHLFHLRRGNPKQAPQFLGFIILAPSGKKLQETQAFPIHQAVWFQDGFGKSGVGQIPALVSGGTGPGLLHLQQSLNKSRVSGAEGKGGLGRERRGSVSAAGGQNPNPAGQGQWAPLSLGD